MDCVTVGVKSVHFDMWVPEFLNFQGRNWRQQRYSETIVPT